MPRNSSGPSDNSRLRHDGVPRRDPSVPNLACSHLLLLMLEQELKRFLPLLGTLAKEAGQRERIHDVEKLVAHRTLIWSIFADFRSATRVLFEQAGPFPRMRHWADLVKQAVETLSTQISNIMEAGAARSPEPGADPAPELEAARVRDALAETRNVLEAGAEALRDLAGRINRARRKAGTGLANRGPAPDPGRTSRPHVRGGSRSLRE